MQGKVVTNLLELRYHWSFGWENTLLYHIGLDKLKLRDMHGLHICSVAGVTYTQNKYFYVVVDGCIRE